MLNTTFCCFKARHLGVFLFALLFSSFSVAQNRNEECVNKVFARCTDAKIISVDVENSSTMIKYVCGNSQCRCVFDEDNNLLFSEKNVDIPVNVLTKINKKLEKNNSGWKISNRFLLETSDTSYYKLELEKDGVSEFSYFSLDGKYYRGLEVVNTEKWSIGDLFQNENFKLFFYDLLTPTRVYDLPEMMKEVSGVSNLGNDLVCCVQDELGFVQIFDVKSGKSEQMFRFADVGDFEDLCVKGDEIFVLRSDGAIFSFNYVNYSGSIKQNMVQMNCLNIESLEYDAQTNCFFSVCKDNSFPLQSKIREVNRISSDFSKIELAFTIDEDEINKVVKEKYPDLDLMVALSPSAIRVCPKSGDFYVLSARSRMLVIYSVGKLKNVYLLPSEIYYKPEGLCFLDDGSLLISSEGMKNTSLEGKLVIMDLKKSGR